MDMNAGDIMNVLIIGASTDIGLSLSKYLISKGYKVIGTYYKHKRDNMLYCDVTNEDSIKQVFNEVILKYQHIDIVINMSGISQDNLIEDKTISEFMQVIEVNLGGAFLVAKVANKYMNKGIIVNISSTDGIDTYSKYNLDYSASKGALITLSRNLSLCTDNKVLCICPNWIDSDTTNEMNKEYLESELVRIGQSRLITIDEFNDSLLKIISDDNISGSVFRIDIKGDKLWIERI